MHYYKGLDVKMVLEFRQKVRKSKAVEKASKTLWGQHWSPCGLYFNGTCIRKHFLFSKANIHVQLRRSLLKKCSVLGFQESRQKGTRGVLMIYHVYDPWIKRSWWVRPLWFIASGSRVLLSVWGGTGISLWTIKVPKCWFTCQTKLAQNKC